MTGDKYRKLLNENITKSYKTTSTSAIRDINYEAGNIATRLGIAGRVEIYAEKEPYIIIKNHEEDFPYITSCRLINMAKSEIGMISKSIVEGINSSITENLLHKAIDFAKAQEEIIWHARRSLLFVPTSTWVKQGGSQFNVTMGSYDGAEICELISLYVLLLLSL